MLRRASYVIGITLACLSCGRDELRRDTPAARGTTVVVALGGDPGQLNPAITTGGGVHPVTDQIFNGLVGLDEQLRPVPELAERWDVEDGGRRYRFHLRRGVTWHDGVPFTSADVVFSFEQVLLRYHSRTRAGLGPALQGISAPDDSTVVFEFRHPYAPLLLRLDVTEASIVPKHVYGDGQDLLAHPANQRPVGTGPFVFTSYARGDRVVLSRNPRYFRPGLPGVDHVVFRILASNATAALALESGDVDYSSSVPGPDVARFKANPTLRVVQSTGGSGGSVCQEVLIPNLARPPLNRLDVRRAIYHAVDLGFIAERVYFSQGQAATGPISSRHAWAYTAPGRHYAHDTARAAALLDAAGLRRQADGTRPISLSFVHAANQVRLADVLRDQLRAVGITLRLEPLDFNAAVDRVFVKKDFDLGFASFCNGADPDIGVRRVYSSSNIGPIPFSNGAGYRNPVVDSLFDAGSATLDLEARRQTYARIQEILAEDLPYFWLFDSAGYRAWRATFTGFRPWSGAFLEAVRPVEP
ncbi:MAG: ABC transporter substrate-binding protein [Cytophagaceae bacterium]|nr:ABC transporter substrate-binding protein [Gemmatimonadaceae bacterium]